MFQNETVSHGRRKIKEDALLITINIRTSMVLSEILGNWKFQISLPQTSTFGDLLNELTRTYGDALKPYLFETDGKTLVSHIMFMVNGRNIRFLNKEKTVLHDNDDITILLQSIKEEALPFQTAKDFIGGAGFGIKYLFDEVPANSDALGPDNKLIFAPGPLSWTNVPCASRMAVTAKSPLTGAVGMGLSGGHFPVELKFAGYDVLIIEGKSEEPVYIWIKDGEVKFRSSKKLWGMKTTDTQQIIKNDLNDQNVRIACIGPAGENQIKIASIINEWRAVGRKGLGAVMGSKNLKAIAVRGFEKVKINDRDKFKKAGKVFAKAMKDSPVLYPAFSNLGTPMVVDHLCHMGIFPTKNFLGTGAYDPIEQIGTAVQATRNAGKEHCYGCPAGCSQVKLAKTGEYAGIMTEGPEFETMYSFGGVTGVENIDTIIAADRLADEMGFDTISSGVSIAFAMELYEKGILTKKGLRASGL